MEIGTIVRLLAIDPGLLWRVAEITVIGTVWVEACTGSRAWSLSPGDGLWVSRGAVTLATQEELAKHQLGPAGPLEGL